jgi:hypothetical protein
MVRLLTINACNAYITAGVLSLAGGFQDPRLLLPGWIGIATVRSPLTSASHRNIHVHPSPTNTQKPHRP